MNARLLRELLSHVRATRLRRVQRTPLEPRYRHHLGALLGQEQVAKLRLGSWPSSSSGRLTRRKSRSCGSSVTDRQTLPRCRALASKCPSRSIHQSLRVPLSISHRDSQRLTQALNVPWRRWCGFARCASMRLAPPSSTKPDTSPSTSEGSRGIGA